MILRIIKNGNNCQSVTKSRKDDLTAYTNHNCWEFWGDFCRNEYIGEKKNSNWIPQLITIFHISEYFSYSTSSATENKRRNSSSSSVMSQKLNHEETDVMQEAINIWSHQARKVILTRKQSPVLESLTTLSKFDDISQYQRKNLRQLIFKLLAVFPENRSSL